MIDRKTLKERILNYNSHLNTEEFKIFDNKYKWKEALLNSSLLFTSHNKIIKVDFANINFTGPEINNQEWRAQLNRYLWLETCMIEDQEGGDGYFSQVAVDTVNAFYKFRKGLEIPDKEFLWKVLGDNTLSISVRLGRRYGNGWWGCLPFMREDIVTDEFLEIMYESTLEQIGFMIEHMTSAGNWRMNQLVSLLFLGYIFQNDEWAGIGARGITEAFHSQVYDDGCHEERTPSYHSWMTMEFTSLFYLSKGLPEFGLNIGVDKLIKMWEYMIIASCPEGKPVGLNDDLRWGYVNMERPAELLLIAKSARANLIKKFTDKKITNIDFESRYFKSAGQWFIKDKEADNLQFVTFDATIYGGGHCHRAINSVNFFYGNKMLLLDPGSFNYERSDIFCDYGRRTQSHNTLCVDNMSQLESSAVENVSDIHGKCVFVHNTYSGGYTDGENSAVGSHERLMLLYKGKICLINDSITGNGRTFRTNFNFLPGEHVFNGESFTTGFDDYNLLVKPIYSNTKLKAAKYEGSMEPMAGWLSVDGYKLKGGEKGISMVVEGGIKRERGSVTAYALLPFEGTDYRDAVMLNKEELELDEIEDIKSRIYNKPVCYSIQYGDSVFEVVSAYLKFRNSRLHPSIGKTGLYDSDGKLAFVEFVDKKPVFAYIFDGTYLTYNGITLIRETDYGNYEKTF